MTQIYLVTHAEATHHVDDIVGGWYDSELTERGRAQAQATAQILGDKMSGSIPVYSSDLRRTVETAQPIAQALGAVIKQTADLREVGCGPAEGKPQAWLDERMAFPPADPSRIDHEIIPGAETRRSVATRIDRFVKQLLEQAPEQAVIVTHGFAATFVIASWLGMPVSASAYVGFKVSPCSITTLEMHEPWGNRELTKLSDTNHLLGV